MAGYIELVEAEVDYKVEELARMRLAVELVEVVVYRRW